jgi:coenzyme PQQ precursor peptide PqqA
MQLAHAAWFSACQAAPRGSPTGARAVGSPQCGEAIPRSNKSAAHVEAQGSGMGWSHRCGGWIAWHTTCTFVARDPAHRGIRIRPFDSKLWRLHMKWTTPSYTEMRFGFEVTMYIANR